MAKKKTGPGPMRHGSFPVGHSCHTTWIPAWPKIWSVSFSAFDSMSIETCLKLKTRTVRAIFSLGFRASIVFAFSVAELTVPWPATLPCCPESDFANNDVATKQMTTRLAFIEVPHKVPPRLARNCCYLHANAMGNR